MKDLNKELISIIKSLEGRLIGVGLYDEKIITAIDSNKKIIFCDILNSLETDNNQLIVKTKVVNIRKFKKRYKHKRVDNMICSYDEIKGYLKYFIKDSIYINKGHIYLFGNIKDTDFNLLTKRYQRYQVLITKKEYNDTFILIIDTSKAKNSRIKDFFYYIGDTFYNAIELFSTFLVN